MSDLSNKICGFVECAVTPLLDYPDDLDISCSENDQELLIELSVNPEDAGKVIGKRGRIINAIRTLARAAAYHGGKHIEVEILD